MHPVCTRTALLVVHKTRALLLLFPVLLAAACQTLPPPGETAVLAEPVRADVNVPSAAPRYTREHARKGRARRGEASARPGRVDRPRRSAVGSDGHGTRHAPWSDARSALRRSRAAAGRPARSGREFPHQPVGVRHRAFHCSQRGFAGARCARYPRPSRRAALIAACSWLRLGFTTCSCTFPL